MAAKKKKKKKKDNGNDNNIIYAPVPPIPDALSAGSIFTGQIHVGDDLRVTILDRAVRDAVYAMNNAQNVEVVIREPANPARLLTNCPGGPGGNTNSDNCCPC